MRAMNPRRIVKGLAIAAAVTGCTLLSAPPGNAEEIGPVPSIEVDAAKAELGKRLFFDKRLLGDAAISCATCHIPDKGFADGLPLSKAYPGSDGFRNAPTLINTAHKEGVVDYLVKPVEKSALVAAVTRAAQQRTSFSGTPPPR